MYQHCISAKRCNAAHTAWSRCFGRPGGMQPRPPPPCACSSSRVRWTNLLVPNRDVPAVREVLFLGTYRGHRHARKGARWRRRRQPCSPRPRPCGCAAACIRRPRERVFSLGSGHVDQAGCAHCAWPRSIGTEKNSGITRSPSSRAGWGPSVRTRLPAPLPTLCQPGGALLPHRRRPASSPRLIAALPASCR